MLHQMKLNPEPFSQIASGQKTIELRLYDEKRQKISVGDEIEFTCEGKKLLCKVIALNKFDSFAELYEKLPLTKCGYTPENVYDAHPNDMEKYYSPGEQKLYGVIGIELKLI